VTALLCAMLVLADTTGVTPETPLSTFGPIVAAATFLATILGVLAYGATWFDKRVRAWLAGEEGRLVLGKLFWEYTETKAFGEEIDKRAMHKAATAVQTAQIQIDQSIRAGFESLRMSLDKQFDEIRAELKSDREHARAFEAQFHRFVGAQTGHGAREKGDPS
jgi:hypothetical protein